MNPIPNLRVQLEMNLKTLKLPTFLKSYQKVDYEVLQEGLSCEQYLHRLTGIEIERRKENKVKALLQAAKIPLKKSLCEFNFDEVPSLNRQTFLDPAHGHFLNDSKNLILYGPPGTDKSHLCMGLARELCMREKRVLFFTVCELTQRLIKEKNNLRLSEHLKRLNRTDLICIDELGFIPFERTEVDLLFQCISACYEKTSIMITTHLVLSEWDQIFKDTKATRAAIDRLIHHAYLFGMENEESFRAKVARKNLDTQNLN